MAPMRKECRYRDIVYYIEYIDSNDLRHGRIEFGEEFGREAIEIMAGSKVVKKFRYRIEENKEQVYPTRQLIFEGGLPPKTKHEPRPLGQGTAASYKAKQQATRNA
jgi:hypothetical protein